ncbi:hypothetical protein CHRYSEO8AT_470199 [Chryseobacterium sp. 8AT]|nr:hypothetical protein CHRYSEO8AT_470199 [Chryseobacterium sp. 8AT]
MKLDNKVTDSVAQLVEQYTFNVWVLGSNPSRVTSEKLLDFCNFIACVVKLVDTPS